MQTYTTQMDAARKGIITPEMEIVAKKEYRTTEEIRQWVAEGKVAIPANKHHTCLNPEGVGSMLRTKIGEKWYPSATGLGTRPTVNDDTSKVTCETFIPGFSGDLYGADPVVEFHAYLSPSKKFDSLDELKDCIHHAARRAQEYFAKPEKKAQNG